MRIEERTNETVVHCGAHMDISCVMDQKEIFLQVLQIKKPIKLEASEISKIDTAGIQLFLNFTLTASKLNLTWQWQNPSSRLIALSALLGVDQLLALKQSGGD